jgi:cytochrome c peroxidase
MPQKYSISLCLPILLGLAGCPDQDGGTSASNLSAQQLTPQQELGRQLFFDTNLSTPPGQSCATCHDPATAFADPDQAHPTSEGVHAGRFGNRNTPTAMYAAFSPEFYYDETEGLFIGGQFVDGRAATLEEQAKGPFLNLLEMANPDKESVITKVREAEYAPMFEQAYRDAALWTDTERAYEQVAAAIAAFERSAEFAPFSSKYDAYLAGKAELTPQELLGLQVFEAEDKGNCAACHPSRPAEDGTPPLFTDFTYDNLGSPRNLQSEFLKQAPEFNPAGLNFTDLGLGGAGHLNRSDQHGKFKVPTLRNIARTAPYMHNGVFQTLPEATEFYNSRDTDPRWGAAESADNVNTDELGNLGLSAAEIDAIVAFLHTLSDGYQP